MFPSPCVSFLLSASVLSSLTFVHAQSQPEPPSSWPHVYPGMPTGDYSPEWQNYFEVKDELPNVTWPLPRNWAGNIPVQREGHPNNTLFFWAFESSPGSFTADSCEPWGIWLNGGPGSSSLFGLLLENGPITILGNYSAAENPHAWSTISDYVWIDQSVGTGFSTVDPHGYVHSEDQVGADFMGFLENFTKVFPHLRTRPLYLSGESYAGVYIPYITKTYCQMDKPPVTLRGIAIGDASLGSIQTTTLLPVISVLATFPQIIGYRTEVFEYFQEQSALCGYNLTLQYPQLEHFPTLNPPLPDYTASSRKYNTELTAKHLMRSLQERFVEKLGKREPENDYDRRLRARDAWKRDRANETIDSWYKCDLYTEMIDFAKNFSLPWSVSKMFDPYDIQDAANSGTSLDLGVFLNDPRTRRAIHAPTSKNWMLSAPLVFQTNDTVNSYGDPSVEPMAFLTELATNMTDRGIKFIVYSGNSDSLVPHYGTQVVIQNTTFGGIQGFTRKPQTPWYNDDGEFAGIVHQERGWTYVLVADAGHLVPHSNPESAYVLARDFIFGHDETGLVKTTESGEVIVIGGEDALLEGEILRGRAAIYYGNGTTTSTYIYPSATVEAWNSYIATTIPQN